MSLEMFPLGVPQFGHSLRCSLWAVPERFPFFPPFPNPRKRAFSRFLLNPLPFGHSLRWFLGAVPFASPSSLSLFLFTPPTSPSFRSFLLWAFFGRSFCVPSWSFLFPASLLPSFWAFLPPLEFSGGPPLSSESLSPLPSFEGSFRVPGLSGIWRRFGTFSSSGRILMVEVPLPWTS